jgi:hypothetical protein
MRWLIIDNNCDRAMLWPQPEKYADTFNELLQIIAEEGPWDKVSVWKYEYGKHEWLVDWLLAHPDKAPKEIDFSWGRCEPLEAVRIKIKAAGKLNLIGL